jgi:hypothetical protein
MKKIKLIAYKPFFLALPFVFLFVILTSFKLGAFNPPSYKKKLDFSVISLVPNLVIVDVKEKESLVFLLLRNDSNKSITAISLSSSNVNYRVEMIDTTDIVAPGAFYTMHCGVPSPTSLEKGIKVLAVVYEDGSSDGVPEFIRQIFDVRRGTQAQLAHIMPLFRNALLTSKTERFMQKRETVRLSLEQLSEEAANKSDEFRVGLHDEKEIAINKLNQLERIENEKGEDVARKALEYIVNDYEKRSLEILNSLKHIDKSLQKDKVND